MYIVGCLFKQNRLVYIVAFENVYEILFIHTLTIVSSKIYDTRDDFNAEIVIFPFLDGDVPRSPSYGVNFATYSFCESVAVLMLMTSTTETYF